MIFSTANSDVRSASSVDADARRAPAGGFIRDLLSANLVNPEDWERLPADQRQSIAAEADRARQLSRLVELGLLTHFQADRIATGHTHGLVLGNYRVLDKIGSGGMAVVYRAEHLEMRHTVAIKVKPQYPDQDPRLDLRFSAEMRTVMRLRHPNIVAALDSGRAAGPDPQAPVYRYIVMEYVPGKNLEDHVRAHGPLPPAKLCGVVYQVASALAEIHRFHLVHRDLKPTNILLTPEEQAKLLDFGLSRNADHRLTQPGAVLGTIDYMAPEQAKDASAVDIRADIYSLGVTAYWCLTGRMPYPSAAGGLGDFLRRRERPPPPVRDFVPACPAGLDAVVARMLAADPADRFQTPQELMNALLPFMKSSGLSAVSLPPPEAVAAPVQPIAPGAATVPAIHRALLVDDDTGVRDLCRVILSGNDVVCDAAPSGEAGLELAAAGGFDLVLLDMVLPGISGKEVLRRLRAAPPTPNVKIIMLSGTASSDEMSEMLLAGADDYLSKPFSVVQLQGRVKAALRLKDAQDQLATLNRHLALVNAEMERSLAGNARDLASARSALVRTLTQVVYRRFNQDGAVLRMQRYVRCLAEAAARTPAFAAQLPQETIEALVGCAPLFDVGKVTLPDHILNKPGKLTGEEFILMQAHTTSGSDLVRTAARESGADAEFFQLASQVIRHHHERYDGTGYPDGLAGGDIPLGARIVGLCNVYDALRTRQTYRPALTHAAALKLMREAFPGYFDPDLVSVFLQVAPDFDRIMSDHNS